MIQGTEQWKRERTGFVTGSMVHAVLAKGRNGEESKGRKDYMNQLITERLTGEPTESSFSSEYTEWGTATEPLAIAAYEERTGVKVTKCGSIQHPTIEWISASPDGLVLPDGCIEVKCMSEDNHRKYFDKKPKGYHILQMHVEMMCAETFWCDYILYDPRQPEEWQLSIQRIKRDPKIAMRIAVGVSMFLRDLEEKMMNKENEDGRVIGS